MNVEGSRVAATRPHVRRVGWEERGEESEVAKSTRLHDYTEGDEGCRSGASDQGRGGAVTRRGESVDIESHVNLAHLSVFVVARAGCHAFFMRAMKVRAQLKSWTYDRKPGPGPGPGPTKKGI